MEKSLIAQIAEIQKQYDHTFHMTNYKTKDGKTIFIFDMGEYGSADADPEIALQNLIDIIVEKEQIKL